MESDGLRLCINGVTVDNVESYQIYSSPGMFTKVDMTLVLTDADQVKYMDAMMVARNTPKVTEEEKKGAFDAFMKSIGHEEE